MLALALLVPVLFLLAVVVFYGCLLVVLSNRLRPQPVAPYLEVDIPVIDARRRLAPAVPSLGSPDRTAVRFLIVVSRDDPARYHELCRIFGGHGNTEVIVDRRRPDPRPRRTPASAMDHPAERRQRHVDEDLRLTGWAMLRLTG